MENDNIKGIPKHDCSDDCTDVGCSEGCCDKYKCNVCGRTFLSEVGD